MKNKMGNIFKLKINKQIFNFLLRSITALIDLKS